MWKFITVFLTVLRAVPAESRVDLADDVLDFIEDKFAGNAAIVAAVQVARTVAQIPDGDD